MKRLFRISEAQLFTLVHALRQGKADEAWDALGREMGFDGRTVEPADLHGRRMFFAEETHDHQAVQRLAHTAPTRIARTH
ncbi:MAG: hypothetical protein ABFD60_01755 [Bryobacteraceae bacterium]